MRFLLPILMLLLAAPATATDDPMGQYLWQKRPVIVFADNPLDPSFSRQIELLERDAERLEERDVVVITDTDPTVLSDLRRKYRPRGFQLLLVGKDGQVKLRKPFPWDVRELSRVIDKMPLRKQEIRVQKERAAE